MRTMGLNTGEFRPVTGKQHLIAHLPYYTEQIIVFYDVGKSQFRSCFGGMRG